MHGARLNTRFLPQSSAPWRFAFLLFTLFCRCVLGCTCCGKCLEFRGRFMRVGSLCLPCGLQGLRSGCQAWAPSSLTGLDVFFFFFNGFVVADCSLSHDVMCRFATHLDTCKTYLKTAVRGEKGGACVLPCKQSLGSA